MPTIEQRVVEMRFDNKQFEDNAQQSIKTIDKLNDSLDFKNTGESLDKLSKAGNNFKLTGMEMALSTVTEKFSALEIAGITALQNLTNKAVNWGTNFAKSVSVDQISSGWDKYAQKTSAVQTIMAATAKDWEDTGAQMEYVNSQIEKLNWFTDETSYSLLDMTSNIGKFTSNGIALDKSVTAMQGISTWASISGATIQDAGRAMYNLSQAMATGSVKLIDWKSIENANMATSEFKQMAIEAAVAEGTLKKVGNAYETCGKKVKKTGEAVSATNFNEALQTGWFTSDVLMKTLDKYGSFTEQLYDFMNLTDLDTASEAIKMIDDYAAGTLNLAEAADDAGVSADELEKHLKHLSSDEFELGRRSFKAAQEAKTFQEAIDSVKEAVASGWMQTFEYIFGNYTEAKVLWTNLANELYDVFATAGNNRNDILKIWHKGGGYDAFLQSLDNLWTGLKNIAAPIKDAFAAVFDPFYDSDDPIKDKANALITFTQKFAKATEKFKNYIGDFTAVLSDITEPVKKAVKPVKEAADEAAKVVDTITKTEKDLDKLVKKVIHGDYGNGKDRVKALRELGYSYEIVQTAVNKYLGDPTVHKTLEKDLKEHEEALAKANIKRAKSTDEVTNSLAYLEENEGKTYKIAEDGAAYYEETLSLQNEANRRAEILRAVFVNIFDVINFGKELVKEIGTLGLHVAGRLAKALEGPLWDALDNITDWLEYFREEYNPLDKLHSAFETLTEIVDHAMDVIEKFFKRLSNNRGIKNLGTSLSNLAGMIGRIIGKIFGKLGDWGKSDAFWDAIDAGFEFLAEQLGEVADFIAGILDVIAGKEDAITNFLKSFSDGAPGLITDLAGAFTTLYEAIKNIGGTAFAKVGEIFGNFFKLIGDQVQDPSSSLNTMVANTGTLLGSFVDKLKEFDMSDLGNLAKAGGIGAIAWGIFQFIKTIVDGLKQAKKIPENINGVLDQFKTTLKSYQREMNAETIYKIAKAIGIFTLSMIGLSLLNEEDLKRVAAAIVIVMGMLALVINQIAKMQAKKAEGAEGLLDKVLEPVKAFLGKIGDAFKNMTKIAGIGIGIVAFAAAVMMLANLAIQMSSVPWDQFLSGLGKVVLVAGLLGVAAFLLSNLAKGMNIQIGAGLILFAVAIRMLMAPIDAIGSLDITKIGKGVGAIGLIAYILSYLASELDGAKVIGAAFGMVLVAGAINLLMLPLMTMALLPWTKLAQGVSAIILLCYALGELGLMMAENSEAGLELMALALAMAIMAVPLLIVGKNAMVCAAGLLVLVAGFAALAIIGGIAQNVTAGLIALSMAAVSFGVGAALFGAGCALVAAAIYIVAAAFPLIVDGLIYLGQAIREHGADLAIGFSVILIAIAGAIVAASPAIQGAIGSVLSAAAAAIVGAFPNIATAAVTLIMGLLTVLYTIAPDVINSLLDIIVLGIHALADGLRNHAAPIFSAIGDILDAGWDMIIEFIASILDMIPGVGKWIGDKVRGAKDWVNPTEEMAGEIGETIKAEATAKVQGTGPAIQEKLTDEMAAVDTSAATNPISEGLSGDLMGMIDQMDLSPNLKDMFSNLVTNNESAINASGLDLGAILDSGAADGLLENLGIMTDAAEETMDGTADAASDEADIVAPASGGHYVSGVVKGVYAGERSLYNAGWFAADTLDKGYRAKSETKSPSRVAMRNGRFWDQGLAIGVTSNMHLIGEAGEKSADTLMNTMRNVIGTIADVLNDDMDLNPTITPVLDLSNVQNGTNALNGMFGNRSFALASANGSAIEANRLAALNRIEATATNSDVVAALGLLRGDVNNLNDSFANTQVVLDSGALVGATARKMDNALGRINIYKGRGI